MIGKLIAHYQILEELGAGGMGVVYKARDTHLNRFVAIKFLPPAKVADLERKQRFVQEAHAASALNHPNIITIHDIASEGELDFIVMELVEGQTLSSLIGEQGLDWREALKYAIQIADALGAAHRAGIIHRDLKPANVMVTGTRAAPGLAKVLDFGLAKLTDPVGESSEETKTLGPLQPVLTQAGTIVGTAAYMSPEQIEGKPIDARSDVFSFGAMFYEMLTGRRAFQGDSTPSTMSAVLRDQPAPVRDVRADVPAELNRVIVRCLGKNREARYASGTELHKDLASCQARIAAAEVGLRAMLRRPRYAVPALALLVVLLSGGTWLAVRSAKEREARNQMLPEMARLIEKEEIVAAYRLAREAGRYVSSDPQFQALWKEAVVTAKVSTDPPGADVYWRGYLATKDQWELLGKTPVEGAVPRDLLRVRFEKEGFEPMERAMFLSNINPKLQPKGSVPPGMCAIYGGKFQFRMSPPVELGEYFLDRYEVTNRQFKEFVDGGGYQKREYWKQPFKENGKSISWDEAMTRFRDATGRPGPANWELGNYPEGRADYPANGVSWYEAAAYAEFAGKSLPTVYHWFRAAAPGLRADILKVSNFGEQGPAPAGSHEGMSVFGNFDMAGNVKEWCFNASGEQRYILGGAWSDPSYVFGEEDAQSPWSRSPTYGFRCAKFKTPVTDALTGPIATLTRDVTKEKPVGDEVFRVYRALYAYDKTDLAAVVEAVDDSSPQWRREKITFKAAYVGDRMIAWLYLPKNARPPFQTVAFFPGSTAFLTKGRSENARTQPIDFLLVSGRAVLYPVYRLSYERGAPIVQRPGPNAWREGAVVWSKDLGRSLDYLAERKDIDSSRLAYYGDSLGAVMGPVLVAMESRLKTAVFHAGGLVLEHVAPEADALNFAPRVSVPVLMLNGRHDFAYPLETSILPLFRLLGTPEKDKRNALYEGGHGVPRVERIKETLEWLDRYLGPVK